MNQSNGRDIIAASDVVFGETHDVIVVGAGAAGYAAAISAAKHGSSVLHLEKAREVGGTTKKAQGWIWAPNNQFMQDAGISDPIEEFLKFVARLSRPSAYSVNHERYGLPQWQYQQSVAFYNNAPTALQVLSDWGAIRIQPGAGLPEYHANISENAVKSGRSMYTSALGRPDEVVGTGADLVAQMAECARQLGVDTRLNHDVQRLIVDGDGRAAGVQVDAGGTAFIGARKAVVFASGGWAQNADLAENFLSGPLLGSCAAETNDGVFVRIANALSADLANMNHCPMAPMILQNAIANEPDVTGTWRMGGDSMIMVNKYGQRVADEKALYNELARVFHVWDPGRLEYTNLVLIAIWDAAGYEQGSNPPMQGFDFPMGNPIVLGRPDQPHMIKATSIDTLVEKIDDALHRYSDHVGGISLDPDFSRELRRSIERFNRYAAAGVDEDFHRGENPITVFLSGPPRPGNTANPTMAPISENGPHYATLMCPSALDTCGGPKTDQHARVLRRDGSIVPGLYAVGNCAGSPFGQAYLGGGATLGPYLTNGYMAGISASACGSTAMAGAT